MKRAKEAAPDPELQRQKDAAAQEKINTIQDRLSSTTDQAMRYYGARRALSGATSLTSPLSSFTK